MIMARDVALRAFRDFLRQDSHHLSRHPQLLFQQAMNLPAGGAPTAAAVDRWRGGLHRRAWIEWLNRRRPASRCLMTLEERGGVYSCSFSKDEKRILSSTTSFSAARAESHSVRLWDAVRGTVEFQLDGIPRGLADEMLLAVSDDREHALLLSEEGALQLLDLSSARARPLALDFEVTRGLNAGNGARDAALTGSAFTADGRFVIVGLWNQARGSWLEVWGSQAGERVATLHGRRYKEYGWWISPHGTRVVAQQGSAILFWSCADSAFVARIEGLCRRDVSVKFSRDDSWIATASDDGWIRLWESATGAARGAFRPDPDLADGRVTVCEFSTDGELLLGGAASGRVRLWETRRASPRRSLEGHSREIGFLRFLRDGRRALSADGSGAGDMLELRLWDLDSARCLAVLRHDHARFGFISRLAFSADESLLATAGRDGILTTWDLDSGERLDVLQGHSGWIHSCSFSADGRHLLTGSSDSTIRLWEVRSPVRRSPQISHTGRVTCCAASKSDRFASASADGSICVWNAIDGALRSRLEHNGVSVNALAWSPSGETLVAALGNGVLAFIDCTGGDEIGRSCGHAGEISCCVFSDDGSRLVTGSSDGTLRLCSAETGECIAAFSAGSSPVQCCALSADTARLAAGCADGGVKVWDLRDGREILGLAGHSIGVSGCAFARSGNRLVTVTPDVPGSYMMVARWTEPGEIKVWDLANGRVIADLRGSLGAVSHALSTDGTRLLVTTGEPSSGERSRIGPLVVWDLERGVAAARYDGGPSSGAHLPSGRLALWTCTETTIELWSDTRAVRREIFPTDSRVECLAWAADGESVAVGCASGAVYVLRRTEGSPPAEEPVRSRPARIGRPARSHGGGEADRA